jgi:hypothetical protein
MKFKKADLFYIGVPVFFLVLFFYGEVTTPRMSNWDLMPDNPFFGLTIFAFAIYGMVMFLREILNKIGDDNDKRNYSRNMRLRR